MVEGTRIRGLDECLGSQELKLNEIITELSKNLGDYSQKFSEMDERMGQLEWRMDKVDNTLGELKQLILNLSLSQREVKSA